MATARAIDEVGRVAAASGASVLLVGAGTDSVIHGIRDAEQVRERGLGHVAQDARVGTPRPYLPGLRPHFISGGGLTSTTAGFGATVIGFCAGGTALARAGFVGV